MIGRPDIHDLTSLSNRPLGRHKYYGSDPHKTRLRIEHFYPDIKVGHSVWVGENIITGTKYKVIGTVRGPRIHGIKTPQFWAELARERDPIYIAGNVY